MGVENKRNKKTELPEAVLTKKGRLMEKAKMPTLSGRNGTAPEISWSDSGEEDKKVLGTCFFGSHGWKPVRPQLSTSLVFSLHGTRLDLIYTLI